jgi:pyrimidine-nucleoside phosphorylase
MHILTIIEKKVHGHALTAAEIDFFIQGYVNGTIPDYQVSSLLMAIKLKGMDAKETSFLTDSMVRSGDRVDLSSIQGVKVDKHSTGGVGDKTSLVIGPIVATLGLKLAKMSGRGLGHTGGTIDKLESIPGFSTSLSPIQFLDQVRRLGIAIVGQTGQLVPADKKLYALRDVTGTVESIPLIASSIMSKKIASGAETILLDVKFGSGAFMKTLPRAKQLAQAMVNIGKNLKRDTVAMITDMEQPLGYAIGNRLEVLEAMATLQNQGPKDFLTLCVEASSMMLVQAKTSKNLTEARKKVMRVIEDGSAYQTFLAWISAQGGDMKKFNQLKTDTQFVTTVTAQKSGWIHHIDALKLGHIALELGAGRLTKDASIDHQAGIMLTKKVGEKVLRGDVLATLYSNQKIADTLSKTMQQAITISPTLIKKKPLVYAVIR